MDRKKTESMPCKNCSMMPDQHKYGQWDDLMCDIDKLPLQIQEAYYNQGMNPIQYDEFRVYLVYYPMDSLQYLEWEYERSLHETPTRSSLQ